MAFDFTPTQWREIRSAVFDGCAQPAQFDERGLLRVANRYLEARPQYRSASARSAAWKRAARLMKQTREALAIADPWGFFEKAQPLFEDPPRAPEYSVSAELERWQRFAALLADADLREWHPRIEFFREVLDYWTSAGGWLRFSRAGPTSRDPGKLGGPTVRYLRAVSDAVMGVDAPTLEGLRKILERCAAEFEGLLAAGGELAAEIEAARGARRGFAR
jgi:hypothetical protein